MGRASVCPSRGVGPPGHLQIGPSLRVLALAALAVGSAEAQTLAYDGGALRDVITDVEARTDWRFLYSDALVAGKRVHVRADPVSLPDALRRALAAQGVGVEADRERRRILLVPAPRRPPTAAPAAPAPRPQRIVRGRVLDNETGEPLPFSTVTWDGGQRGVAADDAGAFVLTLRDAAATGAVPLTASFVGYRAQTAAPRGGSAVFRLRAEAVAQPVVVVSASSLSARIDTAWAAQPGRFDAVGEGGGLRALEGLPSVAPSGLFSDGPIVRGSPGDAFEVRLDGVPVYNPHHLFGLVDAFNGDALRAVALHVGVAPARVAVSPGGAIEYVTAAGAPRRTVVQAGVSSLAVRGAVAVPVRPGRTTALVGARASVLGAAPWAHGAVVEQGLGALRRTSPLPSSTAELTSRVVEVTHAEASFWDVHLGAADERVGGGRTVVTAYLGGDDTRLDATRLVPTGDRAVRRPVATRNRWGSGMASVADRRVLTPRVVLSSHVGGSVYHARFAQDDFSFRANAVFQVDTLGYDNGFGEALAAQRLDAVWGDGVASGGYSLHHYRQRYEEAALARPTYVADQAATRLDLHAGWDGLAAPGLDLDAGVRAHLTSVGGLRLSPRLRARLAVAPGLAVAAAAGRTTQFVHRLTLGDVAGAATWALSDTDDTVTEADLAEATVEIGAGLHLTAYAKRTRGLWFHAEDRAVRQRTDATVLGRPWLTGVGGWARGIEALARVPIRLWTLGASAALARADLSHPALDGGTPFPADWDRLGRLTLLADGPVLPGVRLAGAWTVASGAPNPLASADGEAERLAPISRLDLRLTASRAWGRTSASLSVAVRNALDRDNAVTREQTAVVRRRGSPVDARFALVPLDVYDAGVLPTVDLALRW
ncbi:carboxypeptidase-like regulatory domain-containing protein [Rubrivirga sp.]|uniref:carboxypeptidase-like regulatory domain-containing protein n=1 Tax=Rubrivirga sp. TaxID=1885344 RepID=UPI003B52E66F